MYTYESRSIYHSAKAPRTEVILWQYNPTFCGQTTVGSKTMDVGLSHCTWETEVRFVQGLEKNAEFPGVGERQWWWGGEVHCHEAAGAFENFRVVFH